MYCRDGGAARSFYYKAERSIDSNITTSVNPALEVARRGGESREEVQAVFSRPLLLISLHIMKGGAKLDIFDLVPKLLEPILSHCPLCLSLLLLYVLFLPLKLTFCTVIQYTAEI